MKLRDKIQAKEGKNLSIYFPAGYPKIDSAVNLIPVLEKSGVDFIELGMPFSDPMADGPTVQEASAIALDNGMNIEKLFEQVKDVRLTSNLPIILMGYFNPVLQFGIEKFARFCKAAKIDGVLIPDLPIEVYVKKYKPIFKAHDIPFVFMVTPDINEDRLRLIDEQESPFIYLVAKSNITGAKTSFDTNEIDTNLRDFSQRELNTPIIVGFGISDKDSFNSATKYFDGGIVGSAFLKCKNIEKQKALLMELRSD